jgi:hypothetical protein|tara:strand:+ start:175 stop:1584 length:1410 start_codon:yes stop_codon:yes gene_type:complete
MLEELREKLRKTQQDKEVEGKKGSQPKKYYAKDADGDEMSQSTKDKRADHFKNNKDKEGEDAFKPAPGDSKADTKPSQHTKKYKKMFGEGAADKSLQKKADKSGMPVGILKQVYKRGVAAWKGGHRPGTTPEQWGHARVNSFVTKSKGTWGGADQDLAKKVSGKSESIEEGVDIRKQLKKIKGLTKKQLETLSTMNTSQLTVLVQQLSGLVMGEQDECWDGYKQVGMKKKGDKMVPDCVPESVEEGKLVTDYRSILDFIFKNIKKLIEKEYEKNSEKGLGMINQLGSYVGMKVTDKKQEKHKLFLKFGDNIQEDAAVDAANLKAKQTEELERLKAKQLQELEALQDRHERETDKVNQQKEKEVANKQIQAKRDADRKAAEKQNEERDYKKEYENYHSKPEQVKRRAKRNEARRSLKDRKDIKGKDVHHKDNNPMNNDKSNLSIVSQKYNRTEPRLRKLKEKGILPSGRK